MQLEKSSLTPLGASGALCGTSGFRAEVSAAETNTRTVTQLILGLLTPRVPVHHVNTIDEACAILPQPWKPMARRSVSVNRAILR